MPGSACLMPCRASWMPGRRAEPRAGCRAVWMPGRPHWMLCPANWMPGRVRLMRPGRARLMLPGRARLMPRRARWTKGRALWMTGRVWWVPGHANWCLAARARTQWLRQRGIGSPGQWHCALTITTGVTYGHIDHDHSGHTNGWRLIAEATVAWPSGRTAQTRLCCCCFCCWCCCCCSCLIVLSAAAHAAANMLFLLLLSLRGVASAAAAKHSVCACVRVCVCACVRACVKDPRVTILCHTAHPPRVPFPSRPPHVPPSTSRLGPETWAERAPAAAACTAWLSPKRQND